jgi:hypothetical protein
MEFRLMISCVCDRLLANIFLDTNTAAAALGVQFEDEEVDEEEDLGMRWYSKVMTSSGPNQNSPLQSKGTAPTCPLPFKDTTNLPHLSTGIFRLLFSYIPSIPIIHPSAGSGK